jgi:hypothetical protein
MRWLQTMRHQDEHKREAQPPYDNGMQLPQDLYGRPLHLGRLSAPPSQCCGWISEQRIRRTSRRSVARPPDFALPNNKYRRAKISERKNPEKSSFPQKLHFVIENRPATQPVPTCGCHVFAPPLCAMAKSDVFRSHFSTCPYMLGTGRVGAPRPGASADKFSRLGAGGHVQRTARSKLGSLGT